MRGKRDTSEEKIHSANAAPPVGLGPPCAPALSLFVKDPVARFGGDALVGLGVGAPVSAVGQQARLDFLQN